MIARSFRDVTIYHSRPDQARKKFPTFDLTKDNTADREGRRGYTYIPTLYTGRTTEKRKAFGKDTKTCTEKKSHLCPTHSNADIRSCACADGMRTLARFEMLHRPARFRPEFEPYLAFLLKPM